MSRQPARTCTRRHDAGRFLLAPLHLGVWTIFESPPSYASPRPSALGRERSFCASGMNGGNIGWRICLDECSIEVCHEKVQFWWNRFVPMIAHETREKRVDALWAH
jgi:hypothetical protein